MPPIKLLKLNTRRRISMELRLDQNWNLYQNECEIKLCYICMVWSPTESHENTHWRTAIYACSECGNSFTHSGSLVTHMKTHTGDKPYTCIECMTTFIQSKDIKNHMKTHTGEKPHVCLECGKYCSLLGALKSHENPHWSQATCFFVKKICIDIINFFKYWRQFLNQNNYWTKVWQNSISDCIVLVVLNVIWAKGPELNTVIVLDFFS